MAPGIRTLEWSDRLSTGVELIDLQHKMLINILNEANLCFLEQVDGDRQRKILADLADYTVYHFDTEEEMMDRHGFGEACPEDELAHVDEHRAFAARVTEYQATIASGAPIDHAAVFGYLNNWLVNHVMGTDMKLGRFLKSRV